MHIYFNLVEYLTKIFNSKEPWALCQNHRLLPPLLPRHRTPPSTHHHRARLQIYIKTRSTPTPDGSCKNMAAQALGSSPHKSRRTSFRTLKSFILPFSFALKADVPPQRPLGSTQARDCLLRAFWLYQVVRHDQPPLTRGIRGASTCSSGQVPCAIGNSDAPHHFPRLTGRPHGLPARHHRPISRSLR